MIGGLLTTQEAADRLEVSPDRIYQFVKERRLTPTAQVGRSYLFAPKDVDALKGRSAGYPKGRPRKK